MYFIANGVLSLLDVHSPQYTRPLEPERPFEQVALLSKSRTEACTLDTVYVAMAPDVALMASLPPDTFVITPGDRTFFDHCFSLPCSCAILPPQTDMAEVINRLMDYRASLWEWAAALDCSVAAEEGLQALLDLSEAHFHNPIIIMSKTLRVLAHTRYIPAPHPDVAQTLRNGFFPKHMIRGLIENNYLQAAETFYTIGYHYPPNYINCTKIIKVFKENAYQAHTICLYGLNEDPSVDTMFHMKVLAEYLQRLIDRDNRPAEAPEKRGACLLVDIIEKDLSPKELDSKALMLNWSEKYQYRMWCVRFDHYFYPYVQFAINCIENESCFSLTFLYQEQIVMLQRIKPGLVHSEEFYQIQARLEKLLRDNHACCGMSEPFQDIRYLKNAFAQAAAATRLGAQLSPEEVFHPYRKYYAYHILDLCGKQTSLDAFCFRGLELLQSRDRERGGNNLPLLRSLLRHERNITAVAKEMQMHRNSVLYRVEKLEEALGLSLDDPDIRLMLQLSLQVMDLLPSVERKAPKVVGFNSQTK